MVEIIRRGQAPSERTYLLTCGVCTTHFRFKKDEARTSSDQRDGCALLIACPVCKNTLSKNINDYEKPTAITGTDWER